MPEGAEFANRHQQRGELAPAPFLVQSTLEGWDYLAIIRGIVQHEYKQA